MVIGIVVGLVVGVAAGLAVGWAVHVARTGRAHGDTRLAESHRREAERRLAEAQAAASVQERQVAELLADVHAAEKAQAVLENELAVLYRSEEEAAARAAEERRMLEGTFARLSADALAKSSEQFLQLADARLGEARTAAQGDLHQRQEAIEQLLTPLQETLAGYQRGLQQMETARQGAYEGLNEKVAQLHLGHEQLARETRNLVTALRSPQTRGRWGEMQLRRVAEMAGMVEHCDFTEQQVTATADGARLRPDMVVHVPGGGEIVVDSKVPLQAFLAMLDADDDEARLRCQRQHARQVRTHVDQLAGKEYWKQFERSPQMVVAFIPGDQLLAAAFDADPDLQEYAMANGVLLTTPVTLIALLRTVALGWQQETLAENARAVQKLGSELYDRLRSMTTHLQRLERGLTSTVEAYNAAVGSLETRVLVTARKFPALGVVGTESDEIAHFSPIEKAPRHLQAVELIEDDAIGQSVLLALPESGANTGTGA